MTNLDDPNTPSCDTCFRAYKPSDKVCSCCGSEIPSEEPSTLRSGYVIPSEEIRKILEHISGKPFPLK